MSYHLQFPDVNASRKDYAHLKHALLVTKIFYTLQGEGPFAGMPSVFVRLAGCNRGQKTDMGCAFCDTDFRLGNGVAMPFGDITEEMTKVVQAVVQDNDADRPLVVITGGEPMLQDHLTGFCEWLGRNGWSSIQIESNGDRLARDFRFNKWCETVTLIVSPKASRTEYQAMHPDVITRANYIKALIEADTNSPYYDPPRCAVAKPAENVFLSPITVYKATPEELGAPGWTNNTIDRAATFANYQRAAHLAMLYGYRVTMQQHLFFGIP